MLEWYESAGGGCNGQCGTGRAALEAVTVRADDGKIGGWFVGTANR
jgi:hypothetical protein